MKRKLVCIVCPRGCLIEADVSEQGVEISGNGCPKGAAYAKEECTAPVRTVTSAVRVAGGREAIKNREFPEAFEYYSKKAEDLAGNIFEAENS